MGEGQPSADFEMWGAASLRCLQGCGFFSIDEPDRFLATFYKRKLSQNLDPYKKHGLEAADTTVKEQGELAQTVRKTRVPDCIRGIEGNR